MSATPTLQGLLDLDPEAIRCPHLVFRELRDAGPVHFIEETGCYAVTRYDDVLEVVRNPELFSSRLPTGPHAGAILMQRVLELAGEGPEMAALVEKAFGRVRVAVLLGADPPDHGRQRRLVNTAFGPRRVGKMEADIRAIANGLVDAFVERGRDGVGRVELVKEFAIGLPLTVIARALGVADRELSVFKQWSDALVIPVGNHKPSRDLMHEYVRAQAEFADYFADKVADRKAAPQDDLITDVVTARLDGEELELAEMLAMFQQFLVAGNETTTKLITSMMMLLCQNPADMARVRSDLRLAEGLVEEALRLETPVQGLYRQANRDTEIGGVPIPAGAHLWVLYASANRDEHQFPDPDGMDLARANVKQHLAFSQGPHYCIGATLARTEGRIAIETLLSRLRDIQLTPGANDFVYEPSYVLRGLKELHLDFRAA